MRLAGKSAIITGAGRGIGKATALTFARQGADILVPDLDLAASQETAEEIRALNRKAITAAQAIQKIDSRAARWIASDALRELQSEAVRAKLRR